MTRRSDLPAYDSRVHAYAACGRHAEAEKLFQRPISVATDVGVLAPEYDSNARRQLGDFRQAFYHLALISSAFKLYGALKPVEKCRRNGARDTMHGRRRGRFWRGARFTASAICASLGCAPDWRYRVAQIWIVAPHVEVSGSYRGVTFLSS